MNRTTYKFNCKCTTESKIPSLISIFLKIESKPKNLSDLWNFSNFLFKRVGGGGEECEFSSSHLSSQICERNDCQGENESM